MRKVIILRGVPGAGKSTFVRKLEESGVWGKVIVCSADHFFMRDGEYNFNPRLLGAAHDNCFTVYRRYLYQYCPRWSTQPDMVVIVVDNTNLSRREYQKYIDEAKCYDYVISIVNVRTDPQLAAERNVHGVPHDKVIAMQQRMDQGDKDLPTDCEIIDVTPGGALIFKAGQE